MSQKTSTHHIAEISTLRAVAVILVVLYHAMESLVPSGFIGVDVFFVVSGYVIARSYLFNLIEGKATLRAFYLARFRRLAIPAFVVLLVSSLVAAAVLWPSDLLRYANGLMAQPFYLQNFIFWDEGDYFNRALTKPLLHTWSLAVEEQFYLFFGLCILLFRWHAGVLLPLLIGLALLSFAVGYVLEPRSPKTVFFMFPTRIWEFAFGIFAFLLARRLGGKELVWANPVAVLGLVYLVLSGLIFDGDAPFPGGHALSACLVTALLLILFELHSGRLWSVFRWRPVLYVGEISYGFYLWHWPPLAFFFTIAGRPATALEGLALMVPAFGLAVMTAWLVETPVRRRRMLASDRALMLVVGIACLLTIATAWIFKATDGLLLRYSAPIQLYFEAQSETVKTRCPKSYVLHNPTSEMCPLLPDADMSQDALLILGDSHAANNKISVANIAKAAGLRPYLTTRNCDLGEYGLGGFCSDTVLRKVVDEARALGVIKIMLISHWETTRGTGAFFTEALDLLVQEGFEVFVTETAPGHASYHPTHRVQAALRGQPLDEEGLSLADWLHSIQETRSYMVPAITAQGSRVQLLSPSDYICDDQRCQYLMDGKPIYFDSHHLNKTGVALLQPMFEKALMQ